VAGNYPSIFFIGKDDVRLHPFIIDGPLNTIVPFNNVNCPHGLLYLKKEDNMTRIAMLNVSYHTINLRYI
jgi:hypothetical protein